MLFLLLSILTFLLDPFFMLKCKGWVLAYMILVSAPVPLVFNWAWNWVGLGWDWALKGLGLGLDIFMSRNRSTKKFQGLSISTAFLVQTYL